MTSEPEQPERKRWILPALAVLFFGPLFAAWLFYYAGSDWRPGDQVNHGRLLSPVTAIATRAQDVDAADAGTQSTGPDFRGAWSLVTVGAGSCDAQCLHVIDKTRRVRLALREKAPRVRRVLLYAPEESVATTLAEQAAGLALITVVNEPGRTLLAEFRAAGGVQTAPWSVFLVDPLGNVFMVFEPEFEMRGMLADLKRLLRLSRIG